VEQALSSKVLVITRWAGLGRGPHLLNPSRSLRIMAAKEATSFPALRSHRPGPPKRNGRNHRARGQNHPLGLAKVKVRTPAAFGFI